MANRIIQQPGFRESFKFVSKDIAHWFPGHMHKGMKQMQSKLKDVDCIVEVHDARIPFSGRNPSFKNAITLRPHILLLNKADLADHTLRRDIEGKLKAEGVDRVFYTNCKRDKDATVRKRIIPTVMELMDSNDRFHRSDANDLNLLVIGVPNVGKSSFINAMRRMHLRKGKATQVGSEAGVTRSVLERIKVSERPPMYLFDSPGIMAPRVEDMEVGMRLALCATLKDHLVGEDMIADYMLYWLNKNRQFDYVEHFGMEEPTDNCYKFLHHIAQQNNLTKKLKPPGGGIQVRPDYERAAQIAIRAFRDGMLGKIMLDSDKIDSTNMYSHLER